MNQNQDPFVFLHKNCQMEELIAEFSWKMDDYNDMKAMIYADQVLYKGWNYSQSGGGFFGGHQSLEEAIIAVPDGLNVPTKIASEIEELCRRILKESELVKLSVALVNNSDKIVERVYFQLDNEPVRIETQESLHPGNEMKLFEGSRIVKPTLLDLLICWAGLKTMIKIDSEQVIDINSAMNVKYLLDINYNLEIQTSKIKRAE